MPDPDDNRRSRRYASLLEASLLGGDRQVFDPPWLVRVVNISTKGVGIHCTTPFDVGTVLTIQMCAQSPDPFSPRRVKVVHATEQANGTWIVGVEFVEPLNEAEFHVLLLRRE